MRISDWSSDVCSSDLIDAQPSGGPVAEVARRFIGVGEPGIGGGGTLEEHLTRLRQPDAARRSHEQRRADARFEGLDRLADRGGGDAEVGGGGGKAAPFKSEEHTSELQSLMRHSYAVFCLKKT